MLAGVALLALAALLVWALLPGDGEQPASQDGQGQTPTTGEGSPTTPTTSPEPRPSTRAAMAAFVTDYLGTVTRDPAAAWQRLTPQFQAESGGFESYSGFWGTIDKATPSDIEAEPEGMTVSYAVDYVREDGSRVQDEVELQLVRRDDSYLIAGESG